MDTTKKAGTGQPDVRKVPLATLGSFAVAGLLDRNQTPISNPGVKVAAFNSSI